MAVITLYILFALTTAIVAVYEIMLPLRHVINENEVIENWNTTVFTFFIISFLVAPFMLLPTIVPSMGERFRWALLKELQVDKV